MILRNFSRDSFVSQSLKLLLTTMVWCGASPAQQIRKEPVRAPFFQGEALPAPPQQNAPWAHGDDPLSKAADSLFAQGLADPRGLEYREIEIAVGNPWGGGGYPLKTHGWVLPAEGKAQQFAVAWNGLVYPVVSVGQPASIRDDLGSKSTGRSFRQGVFEASAVHFATPESLKAVLLLRLGETELAQRLWQPTPQDKTDPYLALARDWTWNAFERAVCAHQRGDDRLALADARLLTRLQPLIEAEAKRRGFKPDPDFSNTRFPDRIKPYLPFLTQLTALLADCERRTEQQKTPPPKKDDIAALIDDLQNADARQMGQPGGVWLAGDCRVQALVKRGNEAIKPLLSAVEHDQRLTRSVSFGRDFFRSRQLISVSSAAYAALTELLSVDFKTYGQNGEPLSKKELAAQIRAYWAKMGNLSPTERFYATLKDDKADKDQWLQAAANIVRGNDVLSIGDCTTIPNGKPGEENTVRGESLRVGRMPSVSQLLAKRSDDIAAIRTGSSADSFLFLDAGQMALHLADWDKKAAVPTLKERLARAWSIGAKPNDILAFNGNPVENYGRMIADMTLARARCGDETAYDEFAAWIQKVELMGVSFGSENLHRPLIQGMARPKVAQALHFLFNDPKSPSSNVLAPGNRSWLLEFWQTPFPKTTAFRRQALLGLADKSAAGTITFNPRENWNSHMEAQIELKGMSLGYRGSDGDPDTPPAGKKLPFRVCDVFAYFYSKHQNGPNFQLFWPEIKRDAGVLSCRNWLEPKK